jgi:nucleotide-binding universal stress UspA family protein
MDVMTGLTLDTDDHFLHAFRVPRRMGAPYRHICCCLDESGASARALAEARRLRAVGQGRLTLLHVVQFPLPYSAGFGTQASPQDLALGAHQWLDPMAAEVPEGEAVMLQGYPGAEACEWAQRNAVDLLVCAAHRNLPQRLALGSFAHYLVNHAPCPVLVLRPPGG